MTTFFFLVQILIFIALDIEANDNTAFIEGFIVSIYPLQGQSPRRISELRIDTPELSVGPAELRGIQESEHPIIAHFIS